MGEQPDIYRQLMDWSRTIDGVPQLPSEVRMTRQQFKALRKNYSASTPPGMVPLPTIPIVITNPSLRQRFRRWRLRRRVST
ncbi:MAG TPA: hypothetical protein VG497_10320 [Kribbella sp.]|nr:hypothetical protein [Kribbella sp.]